MTTTQTEQNINITKVFPTQIEKTNIPGTPWLWNIGILSQITLAH